MSFTGLLRQPFVEISAGLAPSAAVHPLIEQGDRLGAGVCIALGVAAVLHGVYRYDAHTDELQEVVVVDPPQAKLD
jgi:hypothetical protein